MWWYSIAIALFAAVITAFWHLVGTGSDNREPIGAGVRTLVISVLLNVLLIYVFNPYFTYWSIGGFAYLFFTDLIIGVLISLIFGASDTALIILCSTLGLLTLWFILNTVFISPGILCDNNGYQQMVKLMQLQDSESAFPKTDPEHLIRVAPKTALLKATRAIGGEANIGAYLRANRAYLQKVKDHWYFIVDLAVTDQNAFRTKGAVVPGYVVVDAQDPEKPAELRTGYKMIYTPGDTGVFTSVWWQQNLDRYVYLNFLLGTQWRIDDLDGLEVDDDWNPIYTGTLLRHAVGWAGMAVDGVITVDPQTGKIEQYSVENAPKWIDRIWSQDLVKSYANWWGLYVDHKDCLWQGGAGQRKVDDIHYVVTTDAGLEYQITMTSVGPDQSLTEVIYVAPRTGQARRYALNGQTENSIQHLMEEASRKLNPEGLEAQQCQIHLLLGRQVWYCILLGQGRGGPNTVNAGSYAGVGLVQVQYGTDQTKVIEQTTLQEAYDLLRQQIATDTTDRPDLAQATQTVQVRGILQRKGILDLGNNIQSVLFTLDGPGVPKGVVFRASAKNSVVSLMKEGDEITVTAITVRFDAFTDVVDVTDSNLPNFVRQSKNTN